MSLSSTQQPLSEETSAVASHREFHDRGTSLLYSQHCSSGLPHSLSLHLWAALHLLLSQPGLSSPTRILPLLSGSVGQRVPPASCMSSWRTHSGTPAGSPLSFVSSSSLSPTQAVAVSLATFFYSVCCGRGFCLTHSPVRSWDAKTNLCSSQVPPLEQCLVLDILFNLCWNNQKVEMKYFACKFSEDKY